MRIKFLIVRKKNFLVIEVYLVILKLLKEMLVGCIEILYCVLFFFK